MNKICSKILNSISVSLKESLNFDNIKKIYLYPKDNLEDFNILKNIGNQLWHFFDDGYNFVGLDGFKRSCLNSKSLIKNANLVKLIYFENELITASVYTGKDKGYKCIGITATTNIELRK